MSGFMLIGLGWLLVNYIADPYVPFMMILDAWNYITGFDLLIVGLFMTMGWR